MRFLLIASLCSVAAGCSFGDNGVSDSSPSAIRDAYLMAHGMVEGYRDQGRADPRVVAELSRLDVQAALAVRDMADNGNADESERAVAALTAYAAQQSVIAR